MKRFAAKFQGYSDVEIDAIIVAGGGLIPGRDREALTEALYFQIVRAQNFPGDLRWKMTREAKNRDFVKINRAASRLLKTLAVEPDGDPHIAPRIRRGFERVGFEWAKQWYRAHEVSNRRSSTSDLNQRKCRPELRRESRIHRLHGEWPTEKAAPDYFDRNTTYETSGQDLGLNEAVKGLQRIRTLAANAAKSQRTGRKSDLPSDATIEALPSRKPTTHLVGYLADLFPDFFGRSFGISKLAESTRDGRRAGDISGPGICFIQACLKPLEEPMSGAAIEKAWDAFRRDRNMVLADPAHPPTWETDRSN